MRVVLQRRGVSVGCLRVADGDLCVWISYPLTDGLVGICYVVWVEPETKGTIRHQISRPIPKCVKKIGEAV